MSRIKRVILNPASPREARTAAERLLRDLDLRVTTTSEWAHGWLVTTIKTPTEIDSVRLVGLLTSRHVRARYEVAHSDTDDYVIIRWRKQPCP